MISPKEKVLLTNSHYFLKIYNFSTEHFYVGRIIWPKFAKFHPKKYAPKTEKFHLRGPASQTMGTIEKLNIPFCSHKFTERIICASQLCRVNIFWATSFILSRWHPKVNFLRIFYENSIFSETFGRIDKPWKLTHPIFSRFEI